MLTQEELQVIIDQFDEEELKRQGIFGILKYGSDFDQSFIKANKEGLELFALELLKSARDAEKTLAEPEKNIIPLDSDGDWVDQNSDTFIQYVEPIADKQKIKSQSASKSTFKDNLVPYGCLLVAIIIIISVIVGLFTIIKWLI